VGDRFLLLKRGQSIGYHEKEDITLEELTGLMAGGAELEQLVHELRDVGTETGLIREIRDEIQEDAGADVGRIPVTGAIDLSGQPEDLSGAKGRRSKRR
jgi:simple sugar transport system ATP-binding protein